MKIAIHALLGSLLLISAMVPAGLAQAPLRQDKPADAGHAGHDHYDIDPKLLIKAQNAYEIVKQRIPLVVDVRSRVEYNAEHIKGAISYPYQVIRTSNQFPFGKDRQLLLYCGCPHHLSGLSAESLKEKGYTNVKVIDEGYWGWKHFGFPIVLNPNAPKQMSMDVEGQLMQNGVALAYQDIFLLHPETGQLEATRTNSQGAFKMGLHFRGLNPDDQLVFHLKDDTRLQTVRISELTGPMLLDVPQRLARR
ncbi:MAG: rhodanese-like domain-containing protein [Candidatus Sericytochromatia bacterium]|nr:rhodanese-like domain-containing protein [Candidatus Sericytochromatia bacterium]